MTDRRNDPPESPAGGSFSFYDDEHRLDQYLKHRHQAVSSPNLVMEDPAFRDTTGDVTGQRILDLGCGDGAFGIQCIDEGCDSFLGIDASAGMIERARKRRSHDSLRFEVADAASYQPATAAYDLVTSRLALHYLADLGPPLDAARSALDLGGRLVVSVLHPVLTSGPTTPAGQRQDLVVDNYFSPGPRQREWFGANVTWHHRTIESYLEELRLAGFVLTDLRECAPVEERFLGDRAEYDRRLRVPLFLVLAAHVAS